MEQHELNERLHTICERFFTVPYRTVLGLGSKHAPPFEIDKPNKHDTKAQFLTEVAVVDKLLGDLESLLGTLQGYYKEDHPDHAVVPSLASFADDYAVQHLANRKIEDPVDLVLLNAARVGVTYSSLFLFLEWRLALTRRKQELDLQGEEFWSGQGRAPNHYARIIALRFAKEIAKHTGKKPTFGTSSYGDNPSTEFGRALEEVFELLGIKASVRHPAVWAIDQLTEEDLNPPSTNGLFNIFGRTPPEPRNALRGLLDYSAESHDE